MFADDTKISKEISTVYSYEELQNDIDNLVEWSSKWELKFNSSKCHVMHIGSGIHDSYSMLDLNEGETVDLVTINEEKDLGVIFDNRIKFSSNIVSQVNKANKIM